MRRAVIALCVVAAGAAGGMLVNGWAVASRNSSGTYTPTTSGTYPFVAGTTISSSTMNGLFSDLSTEVTDSLSRTGKGGMLAPIRATDGSATAPSVSFTSETGSGLWRAGASDVRMSINGAAARSGWNGTGFRLIDQASGANAYGVGLAAPSLSASYTVTFPAAAPASTLPVSMSSGGVLSAAQIATAQVADQAITADKIANGTITYTQIGNSTILGSNIAGGTITSANISDGTIVNGDQNFGTPSASTDVAIKGYVDGLTGTIPELSSLSSNYTTPGGGSCGTWGSVGLASKTISGAGKIAFRCRIIGGESLSGTHTTTLRFRANSTVTPTLVRYTVDGLTLVTSCGSMTLGSTAAISDADATSMLWASWSSSNCYGDNYRVKGTLEGVFHQTNGSVSIEASGDCGSGEQPVVYSGSFCVFSYD